MKSACSHGVAAVLVLAVSAPSWAQEGEASANAEKPAASAETGEAPSQPATDSQPAQPGEDAAPDPGATGQGASGEASGSARFGDSESSEAAAGTNEPSSAGQDGELSAEAIYGAEGGGGTTPPPPATGEATENAEPTIPVPDYAGARATRDDSPMSVGERFRTRPYIERYTPEWNLWEVGLFTGLFVAADLHNLKVPELPREEYSDVNFSLGGRLGYFPLPFIGVEAEGMAAAGSTKTTGRSAVFYSVRGQGVIQLPIYSVVPFGVIGGGVLGAISEPMGHDGDPSLHFGLGVKAPINHIVSARFDFRDNLSQKGLAPNGSLTHHLEFLLGATFTFERTPPEAPSRRDQDYDGLYDDEDECPTEGALTRDGCPLPPGDSDGDGILDPDDECPQKAGEPPSGCPNLDKDGDGVVIPADQCPDEPGEPPTGCPVRDLDGDGIVEGDKCPTEPETRNGFEDEDGCPDEMPEAVKRFTGVIRGINFKQGTAEIEEASHATLDSAVEILKKHESLRLEVSGHTSSEGAKERNQELSVERASAVRDYLVENGIAEDRVKTRGAGSAEPIADNDTREGRRKNRRIEFRILAQP